MDIKQLIVMRKDLKMRRGKEIAQASHATMKFLVDRLQKQAFSGICFNINISETEQQWLNTTFKKVCVRVNSEHELLSIHQHALENGLVSSLIQDSGKTEFGGKPTYTCCAIGPDISDKIDQITGHLELY